VKIGAFDLLEIGGFVVPPFWLTRLVFTLLPPERDVSVSVHRIGPLVLTTLPGEFTTVLGRRIRKAVAARTNADDANVVAIGLAQSYAYYFATPEEYDAQHYEGSGTLWGREAGTFVTQRLERLSAPAGSQPSDDRACIAGRDDHGSERCRARRYPAGRERSFGAHRIELRPDEPDASLGYVTGAGEEPSASLAALPRWCWREPVVDLDLLADTAGDATPRVAVEVRDGGSWMPLVHHGARQDDDGLALITVAGGADDAHQCWCSYWTAPAGIDASASYRFAVEPAAAAEACAAPASCSPAFTLSSGAPHAHCPGADDER
jgi:neutral ceramidase